jgi:hypothetical protein
LKASQQDQAIAAASVTTKVKAIHRVFMRRAASTANKIGTHNGAKPDNIKTVTQKTPVAFDQAIGKSAGIA